MIKTPNINTLACSNYNGFTLIELLAVLFIMSIAFTIIGVTISGSHDRTVIRTEATRLRGSLSHAREISLSKRVPVTVKIQAEAGSYALYKDTKLQGKPHRVAKSLVLEGDDIIFFPKGNSSGGIITIKDKKDRVYTVEVDSVVGNAKIRRL